MRMHPHDRGEIADTETARYRLLYVGNDLEFLAALRKVLVKPDYHIVYCPHVGSAILFMKGNSRYNLLLFDLELDGKSGIELARIARTITYRAHLPVVVVTNVLDVRRRHSAVDAWVEKRNGSACAETIITLLEAGPRTIDEPILMPDTSPYPSEPVGTHHRSYTMAIILRPRLGFERSE